MVTIELYGGTALAKVLHYYNYPSDEEKIVCPFHRDIYPSMQVNYDRGSCFCHGCQDTFYPIDFVKFFEKEKDELKSFMLLTKILKSKKVSNIKVKNTQIKRSDNKQMLVIASDYYYNLKTVDWEDHDSLVNEEEVLLYMEKRGFSAKTLNYCKAKYTYNNSYPIVFPMFDNGEFKGWVCRTTNKQVEQRRKYLYNEGFSRATTLCGDYEQGKPVVICEGYMDKLKLNQFGLKNVVAILGWKITSEQIAKLKSKGITHVISALDNDPCGKKGTAYLKTFFEVTEFQYPKTVKDAGDMDKKIFDLAYNKTKKLYKESRRLKNGISR